MDHLAAGILVHSLDGLALEERWEPQLLAEVLHGVVLAEEAAAGADLADDIQRQRILIDQDAVERTQEIMWAISSQITTISGEPYSPNASVPKIWFMVAPAMPLRSILIMASAAASASGILVSTPPARP